MSKTKIVVLAIAAGVFLSGIFLFGFSPDFRAVAQRMIRTNTQIENNWHYSAITRIYVNNPPPDRLDKFVGNVEITYFFHTYDRVTTRDSFVKTECIQHELYYAEFLGEGNFKNSPQAQAAASSRAADLALAKAMYKLGSQGWEISGRNFGNFYFETLNQNSEYKNALYFRRLAGTRESILENNR